MILAGHGRLEAAKLLGLEMVPTIKAVGLTDAQKRLFAIADNKLTRECRLGPRRACAGVRGIGRAAGA